MKYFLVILTFVIALIGLMNDYLKPKKKKRMLFVLALLLLVTTVSQIYFEYQTTQKEWQAKWSGRLYSKVKTQKKFPVLKLGAAYINWAGAPNEPMLSLAGEPLTISLVDSRVEVSIVVRDKNGIVLAAIRNNEWFVAPPPVTLDRNFNENSLEIINSKGEVIFQVQVFAEQVSIAGTFYNIKGEGANNIGPSLSDKPSGRLFKYPSSEHPGERANN